MQMITARVKFQKNPLDNLVKRDHFKDPSVGVHPKGTVAATILRFPLVYPKELTSLILNLKTHNPKNKLQRFHSAALLPSISPRFLFF